MSLSSFILRVMFLAIPGIVARIVFTSLKGRNNKKDWEDFVDIVLFSCAAYACVGAVTSVLDGNGLSAMSIPLRAFTDEKLPISFRQIFFATITAIPIAYLATYFHTNRILNRIGRKIGVTSKYGDDDVWSLFQQSEETKWVFVRDHKCDLIYFGWILAYSDSEKKREVYLKDVIVFSNVTGNELYKSDGIYLSREANEITIEIPQLPVEGEVLTVPDGCNEVRNES